MLGCLVFVACMVSQGAAPANDQLIDSFQYTTSVEARSAWKPAESSPDVIASNEAIGTRKGLRFPIILAPEARRCVWDRAVTLDLSHTDKIAFWIYVDEKTPTRTSTTLYFSSGEGWFSGGFAAERGWSRIVLNKSDFTTEGTPTGWHSIRGIRFSVWKTSAPPACVIMSDLRATQSAVAIIQNTLSQTNSAEWETIKGQTQNMANLLNQLGIDSGVLTDEDVEKGALEGREVVIFPHNPTMSDSELNAIEKYLQGGGQAMSFYGVPSRLLTLLGFQYESYLRPEYDGQFASIRFKPVAEGLPPSMAQASWNINKVKPVSKNAQVIGEWIDSKGKATGLAAMLMSDSGIYMSHVLLNEDPSGRQRMMLALLGKFMPKLWPAASEKAIASIGKIGEFETFEKVQAEVVVSKKPTALKFLEHATTARNSALEAARKAQYVLSIEQAQKAKGLLSDAYCAMAVSAPNETRAAWCHDARGVKGMTWDQVLKAMADSGMNAVVPNMLWGGRAYYKSSLLPVDPSVATQGDAIAECVAAAKKYGIKVHVWKVNWNLGNAPAEFLSKLRSLGRTQKTSDGKDIDWLCPSNLANFELERDSMLEVARNYAVDGIHFDYIRYPDSSGCFCDGCRERFEALIGSRVSNWPSDVVSGSLKEKYLDFRRGNITRLVKAVSEEARKIRPGIQISAAVFSDWPECRDSIGQDWVSWLKAGYLDFVCPMNYTPSAMDYEGLISLQIKAIAGIKPMVAGLGVTLGEWTLTPDQVVRQIQITRRLGTKGFIMFNLDGYVVKEILPKLKLGATAGGK